MLSRVSQFFAIGLISLCVSVAQAQGLTESSVKKWVQQIEQAINEKNVNAIAEAISDDASITMKASFLGEDQILQPTKYEYLMMLQQSWAKTTGYSYQRENLKINIKNNQAHVSVQVTEEVELMGEKVTGKTNEKFIVEERADGFRIVKIDAEVTM